MLMQGYIRSDLAAGAGRVAPLHKSTDASGPPLRVLMVAARYLPYSGGTETHVHEVSRRLAQAGHIVGVLTADPTGELKRNEQVDGVTIIRLRAWPRNRDYLFAPGIIRLIDPTKWDLIHIQGYHTLVAPLAMLGAIRSKIPFVITFHSGGHSSGWRRWLRPLQWNLLRPLVSRARRCIGVSRFEAETFCNQMGLDRRRMAVIPNGAELPQPDAASAQQSAGRLILSVGRLERYKGHHRAIEALPYLLSDFPDLQLRIIGSGPYEDDLRRLAMQCGVSDRVAIGAISAANRQELSNLVARASLVTLLSDYEANPVAIMEALSLGRRVLATASSGFIELAEQGLLRTVPLQSDAASIAAAMADELNAPAGRPAVPLPDWQSCADRLVDVYRAALRDELVFRPEVRA